MYRIGIVCPSDIASRRFLPALTLSPFFEFAGVGVPGMKEWTGADADIIASEKAKAEAIVANFGGRIYESYNELVNADGIDAVYIPLPPALHYIWAKAALLAGKHVLIEKPATTELKHSIELIDLAQKRGLAIHENYMFVFHKQIQELQEIIHGNEIGEVRLYRLSFGFPRRDTNDFRYNKALGGGALLDCGGYTLKYASLLLGESGELAYARSNFIHGFQVDITGSGAMINPDGLVVQFAFGMDNSYKCEIEAWGSKGSLNSGRVFTAPAGYVPEVFISVGNESVTRQLSPDDTFLKSIDFFHRCIIDEKVRNVNFMKIEKQASLVDQFINLQVLKQ